VDIDPDQALTLGRSDCDVQVAQTKIRPRDRQPALYDWAAFVADPVGALHRPMG